MALASFATQEKDLTPPYTTRELLRDLWGFLAPYKGKFFVATFARVCSDVAWLYPAYALAAIVTFFTKYSSGDSLAPVWLFIGLWIPALIVRAGGMYVAKMTMFSISTRVSLNAQLRGINHLFLLDMAWHEKENSGNKLKRIDRGGESMDQILRMWINNVLEIAVNLFGIIFILARFDFLIALLTAVFLAVYYFLAFFFRRRASLAAQVANIKGEEINGLFFEAVNNIRSVKVMSLKQPFLKLISREVTEFYEKVQKRIFWFQTGNQARNGFSQLFRVGMLGFIVWGIVHGHYEVGFLVLFNSYLGTITESISELAEITQEFVVAKFSVSRLMDILNEPVGIDNEEGKVAFPKEWQKISLKNVSFAYGEKGENEVLSSVSFDINRGERVGIVGLSGAGKSTLFKLLLKEREQSAGEILIDDVPLDTISKENYFKYVAAVLQETEVFNFTLKQNVVLANNEQAENSDLFDRSLQIAHVSDFLSKLPHGAETLIGEKGVKLSGGEKQRLGLARAVFKQPEILLLDEATSHLDVESEEKIRASLHEFFQSVTALVIAHRLTTVREMDRILVIEDGKILEEGSFENLYEKRGRFFELWEKQKL